MKKLLTLLPLLLPVPSHAMSLSDIPRCESERTLLENRIVELGGEADHEQIPQGLFDDCWAITTLYNVRTVYISLTGSLLVVLKNYGESEKEEFKKELCNGLYKGREESKTIFKIASLRVIYEAHDLQQIGNHSDLLSCS